MKETDKNNGDKIVIIFWSLVIIIVMTLFFNNAYYNEGPTLIQYSPEDNQDIINVQNEGTGNGQFIDQNGNGIALNIDSEATNKTAIAIDGGGCSVGEHGLYTSGGDLYWCKNGVSTLLN